MVSTLGLKSCIVGVSMPSYATHVFSTLTAVLDLTLTSKRQWSNSIKLYYPVTRCTRTRKTWTTQRAVKANLIKTSSTLWGSPTDGEDPCLITASSVKTIIQSNSEWDCLLSLLIVRTCLSVYLLDSFAKSSIVQRCWLMKFSLTIYSPPN